MSTLFLNCKLFLPLKSLSVCLFISEFGFTSCPRSRPSHWEISQCSLCPAHPWCRDVCNEQYHSQMAVVEQSWSLIKWRGVQLWQCYWSHRTDRLIDNLSHVFGSLNWWDTGGQLRQGQVTMETVEGLYDNQEDPVSLSHWPWHLCLNNIDHVYIQTWMNCCKNFISVPARNSNDVAFIYVYEREYYSSSYSKFLDAAVSGGKPQRWAWGDICDLGFVPTEVPPGEADSSWTHLCRERHIIMIAQNTSLLLFPSLCGLVYFFQSDIKYY